jgi:hypothetical protein
MHWKNVEMPFGKSLLLLCWMTVPPVSFTAVMAVVSVVICNACAGHRGPISNFDHSSREWDGILTIRRGDFSGSLSPRRTA